jgi:hypothetical protein
VEGASGSFSLLGVFGCRRPPSPPPLLRVAFRRDEGCGVLILSSAGSEGWLCGVSKESSWGATDTDPAEDMAALPLAFLERGGASCASTLVRFARPRREDTPSALVGGGCSGLDSRGALFLLRVEAGGREGAVVGGGGLGVLSSAEPVDRLAAERVTLDDMRLRF